MPDVLSCPRCTHAFRNPEILLNLVICPKCYATLALHQGRVEVANAHDLDWLRTDEIAALRKTRAALRKAGTHA